ncbi:MAG TPA: DUF4159 domain-containing protein, partial [Candidatus Krumholzibacteria bacterium]|nr:DUF4159 domain-containing protein [Candidatus Krumholzibacteria bacterium]
PACKGARLKPFTLAVTIDGRSINDFSTISIKDAAAAFAAIELSERELAALRRYLDAGGFLYADDNYGLDASFRAMVARLYPDAPLAPLPADHPVFRAYYDLPGLPKIHKHDGDPAQAFGVTRGGRLVILYTWSSDIGDGLEDPDVHGDPAPVREAAAKMAVNILMYALTRP